MVKKTRLILITGILILLVLCAFIIFNNVYGPHANDAFAKEKINILESVDMPDDIKKIETTDFIGKRESGGQFLVWIWIAIKTDLTIQELEVNIKTIPEFEKAEIFSYELNLANKLGFTGIQKTDVQGVYLVGVAFKPLTIFDKRNN